MVEEELRRQKDASPSPSPPPEEDDAVIKNDIKKSPSNFSALSYELYVEQTQGEVEDDNKEQISFKSDLEEVEGGGSRTSTLGRRKVTSQHHLKT